MATPDSGLHQNSVPRGGALQSVPPQRRALLILHNMAGLTTRLIELAGNKEWQGGQNKMVAPQLLHGAVLPPEGAAAANSKEVFAILESQQSQLFEALGELSELQEMENEKQRIADAIAAKDAAMSDFAKRLRDAQQVLESTVEEFEKYKRPKKAGDPNHPEQALEIGLGTVNVQELVAYAHRISYTTFAPPEYAEGAPLRGALPPAPQEEQMRASKLYQIHEADLGLPHHIAKPTPLLIPGDSPLEVKLDGGVSPQQAQGTAQGPPLPSPPAGWKPGMPLKLPPMPAGWKPGDPLPLAGDVPSLPPPDWKPGDAVVLPPNFMPFPGAEGGGPPGPIKVAAPAGPPVPLAPAGGPILVPFVNLDLNPELEDPYGSDFSDEDASSDDDDD